MPDVSYQGRRWERYWIRRQRKIILWGLLASVQHLAVQGNPLVPDSVMCLPFFILLSCILVSEASLTSCTKKEWETLELPSWNNGVYPFTTKLRVVIISDSSAFVLLGKLCLNRRESRYFWSMEEILNTRLYLCRILQEYEKRYGEPWGFHLCNKNLRMEKKAKIVSKEWQKV